MQVRKCKYWEWYDSEFPRRANEVINNLKMEVQHYRQRSNAIANQDMVVGGPVYGHNMIESKLADLETELQTMKEEVNELKNIEARDYKLMMVKTMCCCILMIICFALWK